MLLNVPSESLITITTSSLSLMIMLLFSGIISIVKYSISGMSSSIRTIVRLNTVWSCLKTIVLLIALKSTPSVVAG